MERRAADGPQKGREGKGVQGRGSAGGGEEGWWGAGGGEGEGRAVDGTRRCGRRVGAWVRRRELLCGIQGVAVGRIVAAVREVALAPVIVQIALTERILAFVVAEAAVRAVGAWVAPSICAVEVANVAACVASETRVDLEHELIHHQVGRDRLRVGAAVATPLAVRALEGCYDDLKEVEEEVARGITRVHVDWNRAKLVRIHVVDGYISGVRRVDADWPGGGAGGEKSQHLFQH